MSPNIYSCADGIESKGDLFDVFDRIFRGNDIFQVSSAINQRELVDAPNQPKPSLIQLLLVAFHIDARHIHFYYFPPSIIQLWHFCFFDNCQDQKKKKKKNIRSLQSYHLLLMTDGEPGEGDAGSRERGASEEPKVVPHFHSVSFYGSVSPFFSIFSPVNRSIHLHSEPCGSGYDMIEWLMERLNIEDSGKFGSFFNFFLLFSG